MNGHIVIFEPYAVGHRMIYVRYIVENLLKDTHVRVTLISTLDATADFNESFSDDIRDERIRLHLIDLQTLDRFDHFSYAGRIAKQFWMFCKIRSCVKVINKIDAVDHVLIPFFDDYCLFPHIFFPNPFQNIQWSALSIRPRFHLSKSNVEIDFRLIQLFEKFSYTLLTKRKRFQWLFTIDPYLSKYMRSGKVISVLDPAKLHSSSSEFLPEFQDKKINLLVYGYIDSRKGLQNLIKLMRDPIIDKNLRLIVAGKIDHSIDFLLESEDTKCLQSEGRIVFIDRYITDHEEASLFQKSDIVWVLYPKSHCMSGALVRAGRYGRPVITSTFGVVGRLVSETGMGVAVPDNDDAALIKALNLLCERGDLRSRMGKAGLHMFNSATPEAFAQAIISRII